MSKTKQFKPGELIIQEGRKNEGASRILKGRVEVIKTGTGAVTRLAILKTM